MAKKKIDNEIFKTLIEDYNIKDTNDIKDMLKDFLLGTIQTMLEAEIEHELGYAKHSLREWQSRQLEDVYPIVFMDAIHYSVRKDGVVVKKAVYLAIGIDKEGRKEVLGFWIGENESSKYWLNVLNELKNRGVQDILIMSVDNLKGFSEAISSVLPKTEIQKCVVQQIRNSIRYISYKDAREFTSDLKEMYNAPTLEQAEFKLDELEEKWGKKYMAVINSWRSNWNELTTYFKYDTKIRKLIYTTNPIESLNRQLRKYTKTKSLYPTDEALMKSVYLSLKEATKKWTGRIPGWGEIYSQLSIYFEGRI